MASIPLVCQCCGKTIVPLQKFVKVVYGTFEGYDTYSNKVIVTRKIDYFHENCDIAIRRSS